MLPHLSKRKNRTKVAGCPYCLLNNIYVKVHWQKILVRLFMILPGWMRHRSVDLKKCPVTSPDIEVLYYLDVPCLKLILKTLQILVLFL